VKFLIVEICLGLNDFHSRDIVYRELLPENILINEKGHVFLSDFGNSRFQLSTDPPTFVTSYTRRKTDIPLINLFFCFFFNFIVCLMKIAPEILLGGEYSKSGDFWSLGILIYELLTGIPPFYSEILES